MVTSKKVRGRATPMSAGIAWGVLVTVLTTVLLVAALVWLVLANKIDVAQLGYYIMGILILSSFLGAIVSGLKIKRRWLLVSVVVGGIYYLLLLLMTAFVFGGYFRGVGVTGAMIMLGSVASWGLCVKMNASAGKHTKKYRAG
jgi:putative membrane protein (TIGR04086 family)